MPPSFCDQSILPYLFPICLENFILAQVPLPLVNIPICLKIFKAIVNWNYVGAKVPNVGDMGCVHNFTSF